MDINAEISGVVLKVDAQAGDVVEEGATLLVVESMKMEIPVDAPQRGRVDAILVGVGELVEEGQPLARLAPAA